LELNFFSLAQIVVTEMGNSLDGLNSILEQAKEEHSELEDKSTEATQSEESKEN
jgi:hypothetical protein